MLYVLDDSRLSCLFPLCGQLLCRQLLCRQLLCGRIASYSPVESNQTSSTATDWAVSPRMNFENVPTSA